MTKDLSTEDKKSIILELLVDYCERHQINKVRYSDLKHDCDERINALTDGYQSAFGGSFDKFITDLEAKSESPDKRLVERYKQSPKRTYIIPDISKIKAFLQGKDMVRSFNNLNLVQKKLELQKAAKLTSEEIMNATEGKFSADKLSDKRYYDFMLEAHVEIDAVLSSYNWRLYYASPKNSTFNMPEGILSKFLLLGYDTAMLNKTATLPFRIILEFRGASDEEKDETYKSLHAIKYCEWFVKWARIFHNYEISDEDQNNIVKRDLDSLSNKTYSLFEEFDRNFNFMER
jgi:hypothetical protein